LTEKKKKKSIEIQDLLLFCTFDRWLLEGKRDYQDPIDDYLQMLMEPNVDYELKLVYTKMYDLIAREKQK